MQQSSRYASPYNLVEDRQKLLDYQFNENFWRLKRLFKVKQKYDIRNLLLPITAI